MKPEEKQIIQEVKRLRKGDGKAFEALYNLTATSAYYTALKIVKNEHDAQDVLQESYMIVLDKIDTLKKSESFVSWFNMIVANKAKEVLRKNNIFVFKDVKSLSKADEILLEESLKTEKEEKIPGTELEKKELRNQVLSMIDELSDEKRTVILLYYYNKMTIRQIAQSLDANENTIKTRLFYAKKELSKLIGEYEKKHTKLLGLLPIGIVIWALKTSSATASAAFIASGTAAATLTAVSAKATVTGAASAGTAAGSIATSAAAAGSAASGAASSVAIGAGAAAKAAGLTVAQKVVAGVAVAAVVGGSTAGTATIIKHNHQIKSANTASSVSETTTETVNRFFERLGVTQKESTAATDITDSADTKAEPVFIGTTRRYGNTIINTASVPSGEHITVKTESVTTAEQTTVNTPAETTSQISSTTAATQATTASTTEAPSESTTQAQETESEATSTQTTATSTTSTSTEPTTESTTREIKKAKVNITVTKSGVYAESFNVTLDEGDTFTFADAKSAVSGQGYDTSFAEYSGQSLPLTAEGNKTYNITIDVE